jgi:hypothetical protein
MLERACVEKARLTPLNNHYKQESKQREFNVVTTGYFSIINYNNNNKINNNGNINDHDTIPDNPQ